MSNFEFIRTYIDAIPPSSRVDLDHGALVSEYALNPGLDIVEIDKKHQQFPHELPSELLNFYSFSYGCTLNEHELLRFDQIEKALSTLLDTYGDQWEGRFIPFTYHLGVGDYVLFDLSKVDGEGKNLIVDGFHELPPDQWKPICYGLENWMRSFIQNECEVFWLEE
jgi:hypothetical protein